MISILYIWIWTRRRGIAVAMRQSSVVPLLLCQNKIYEVGITGNSDIAIAAPPLPLRLPLPDSHKWSWDHRGLRNCNCYALSSSVRLKYMEWRWLKQILSPFLPLKTQIYGIGVTGQSSISTALPTPPLPDSNLWSGHSTCNVSVTCHPYPRYLCLAEEEEHSSINIWVSYKPTPYMLVWQQLQCLAQL